MLSIRIPILQRIQANLAAARQYSQSKQVKLKPKKLQVKDLFPILKAELPQKKSTMRMQMPAIPVVSGPAGKLEVKSQPKRTSKQTKKQKRPARVVLSRKDIAILAKTAAKTADPQERLEIGQRLFKHLSKTRNHSEPLIANMTTHTDLLLSYIEYFKTEPVVEAKPEFYIPMLLRTFKDFPDRSLAVMDDIIEHYIAKNVELSSSMIVGFYEDLITNAVDEPTSMQMLQCLSKFSKLAKVAEPELQDYLVKWARLATIDILESCLTPEMFQSVGKYEVKGIYHEAAINRSASITGKFEDVRGGDLLCLQKDEPNSKPFFAIVSQSTLSELKLSTGGVMINGSGRYHVKKVTTLNSYRAEMDALSTFASKGPACTDAYSFIMNKEYNPDQTRTLKIRRSPFWNNNLNQSQIDAIESVVTQPVSLIQGPPGTGKTHTLSKLIKALTRLDGPGQVLVCTPTNAACDNVVQYAAADGLRVIRLGDTPSIRPDLIKHTVDHQVPNPLQNFPDAMRVMRRADVICTTCASSGGALLKSFKFKYVIIDEASQLTETIALIPIVRNSKHVVLIGDHKQLPPSVGHWAKQAGYSESLFARLADSVKPKMLDTQYRSHPMIMEFPSSKFYDGNLKNGVEKHARHPPAGFKWKKDKDNHYQPVAFVNSRGKEEGSSGTSKSNTDEAKVVLKVLNGFLKNGLQESEIGIISPYAGQNRVIRNLLQKAGHSKVELNSVDAFQGREKEVIIFSATRSNSSGNIGFLSDPRRFNVMHTRAKRGLVVVGNRQTLSSDPTWRHWIEWIDKKDLEVKL